MELLLRLLSAGNVFGVYGSADLRQLFGATSCGPKSVDHGGQGQAQRHLPPLPSEDPAARNGRCDGCNEGNISCSVVQLLPFEAQRI